MLKKRNSIKTLLLISFLVLPIYYLYARGTLRTMVFPQWSPPIEIKFSNLLDAEIEGCQVLMPVAINGIEGNFLLDLSRNHSLIGERFLNKKSLDLGILSLLKIAAINEIKIGEMIYQNIRFKIGSVEGLSSLKIDGVLGLDFLSHSRLTIHFDRKKIEFEISDSRLSYRKDGFLKTYALNNIKGDDELGCPFFKKFSKLSIDLKSEKIFYKLY